MKRRRWLQLLPAGGAAATLGVGARTPGVELPPLPGPQRPIAVPTISEQVLGNGMRLLVAARSGVPLVTAALHVRAGRELDAEGQAGLASLAASLLTKGARRRGRAVDASTLARQAEALGASLDVSSGWRVSSLQMTVTTPKLAAALALMNDVLRQPLLQVDELERLRSQMQDSLKVTLASPGDVAGLAARRLFWGGSVHGGSATPTSLQRIRLEDVRRLLQRAVRPDRAVLVLAGDVEPATAATLAADLFGAWSRPAELSADTIHAPARPDAPRRALVAMPDSGQSGVVVTAPFAALGDSDRRVAEVASALLAGGYSARLNQEVRIKRGLSYGVGGGGESHAGGGMFSAGAQTQHSTAREVATLMREEILRAAREEAPDDELMARKANLVGSFARQLNTTSGLAAQIASQHFQGRPVSELVRFADDVLAVKPFQVRHFAASLWQPENLRVVIAGNVPAQGDELVVPITALDLDQPGLRGA